jgi:hypothetical protein
MDESDDETDFPRTLNKVINLYLKLEGGEYTCPYNFCGYTRPADAFALQHVRFHVISHHTNFYVHQVKANVNDEAVKEDHLLFPELWKTDLTDRVMQLTLALTREKCKVAGAGNFERGEQFSYVRVNLPDAHHVLHCCPYCPSYKVTNFNNFRQHVANVHVTLVDLPAGTPEVSTTHEHYFYL